MRYFLAKTDPETYTVAQLQADQRTTWDGVRNPQAVRAIRAMAPGDAVFIYHSMGQSAIVGLAKVVSASRDDPKDPKSAVVDLEFVSLLEPPTTLAEIKNCGLFADFALVRQSRLSTMEVPEAFVAWLRQRYPKAKL
jgi:predicted RNA-binding protein with PUA-like domain